MRKNNCNKLRLLSKKKKTKDETKKIKNAGQHANNVIY